MNDTDRLVEDYLARLAKAAEPLPAERSTDLVAEVTAHIAEARTAGASSPDEVREVLSRLGEPDEIVAAATDGLVLVKRRPRYRSREVAALLLLPFGGFLYLAGWILGVVLLWTSDRWTTTEKWLGTLVLPFGYLPVLMLGSFAGRVCRGDPAPGQAGCSGAYFPGWFDIPVLAALAVAPLLVIGYLIRNARRGRASSVA